LKDLANKAANVCKSSQESTKCHEFCIYINPENWHFINCTEYPCQEDFKPSFPASVDWIQTTVYNKTNAIIFGRIENAENPEFQTWAQQMLQNLDVALTLNNQNSTKTSPEEKSSNSIFLNQWIEFSKFNETTIDQELVWQSLNQQYDDNISNNLIRICITNQDMAQIICTEQNYYNICRLDDPTECVDDIFTAQTLANCRRLKIEDEKVVEITELFCDSLNESIIPEAFQSATGIIILQLIRTTTIHSPPPLTTITAIQSKDQYDRSENIEEKQHKFADNIRLKTDGQAENTFEKIVKTLLSKMSKIAQNSAKKKAEFDETDYVFATNDSITMQMPREVKKKDLSAPENSSEPDTVILGTIPIVRSNLTNLPEIWQDFGDALNGTTNMRNSNDVNEINVTAEIEERNISG
uniref:C-CAP/cofactor C-like domain-containing protein n=1 Tax=Onchocerca flexuosa TaxID=387005 RepID=A0A183H605_9BILA